MPHDHLDLQLLQALHLDGRASFSRIAEVLGVSDQTIARRFQKLRASAGLRVLGVVDEARLGEASWVVRLHCTPDGAGRLADALAQRGDTIYVAIISGGTEVACGLKPRTQEARDDLLLQKLQKTPQVTAVSAHFVIHSFFGGWFQWLSKVDALGAEQQDALRRPAPSTDTEITLDATDHVIIDLLRPDGRTPLGQIQAATGLSEDTTRRRLARLRDSGVLYFDIQYDAAGFGHDTEAMMWITTTPASLLTVGAALAQHPEVNFAAATTGESNLIAAVRCRDTNHLFSYLSERLGQLEGILRIETALILRQVKQRALSPARRS